jgi:hypothetical protein
VLAKVRSYRPSHATVVAYLALFVALGGSSYAAITVTGRNVKNSSLTGKDVKNNSLSGSDVKNLKSGDVANGSLLAQDFAAGELPAGPKGDKGTPGDTGHRGPSDGFAGINQGFDIPPGKYMAWHRGTLSSTTGSGNFSCDLDFTAPSTSTVVVDTAVTTIEAGQKATVNTFGPIDAPVGGSVGWNCSNPANTTFDSNRAGAIKVENLTVAP